MTFTDAGTELFHSAAVPVDSTTGAAAPVMFAISSATS